MIFLDIWDFLFWDFKDQSWPMRIAAILLFTYFLLLVFGVILTGWYLLTLTPLV